MNCRPARLYHDILRLKTIFHWGSSTPPVVGSDKQFCRTFSPILLEKVYKCCCLRSSPLWNWHSDPQDLKTGVFNLGDYFPFDDIHASNWWRFRNVRLYSARFEFSDRIRCIWDVILIQELTHRLQQIKSTFPVLVRIPSRLLKQEQPKWPRVGQRIFGLVIKTKYSIHRSVSSIAKLRVGL